MNFSPDVKLGEGGFGAVYRGTIHGSTVAVKLLSAVSYMYTMHVCLLLIIVQHFIAACITTLCCNFYIKDYINTNLRIQAASIQAL